jgi:hypothetical protein
MNRNIFRNLKKIILGLNVQKKNGRLNVLTQKLDHLRNKNILVLGSSDNPSLPKNLEDYEIICCNASPANIKKLGLKKPIATIVDYELVDPIVVKTKLVRKIIYENNILQNIDVGTLIATQSNSSKGGSPDLLNSNYKNFIEIDKILREEILFRLTKFKDIDKSIEHTLISTGAFAVALALFAGAQSVHISGFNLHNRQSETHFYSIGGAPKQSIRNHSMADSFLIILLVINGYKISSNEVDLLPILTNWGSIGD